MSKSIHPVTLEVIRNSIYAIAEEMSAVIMRSARSPLLREAGDFSSALTDERGRLVAQGKDIPIHLGVMGFTVQEFLKYVPINFLYEGDQYITNLPEVGGNHLPDVKLIRPIFSEGAVIAFAINLAHWADIGGALPGSYVPWATEACQEGLRIPPVKVRDKNGMVPPTMDFILNNVRGRGEREGDLRAQCAANEVAARRLEELLHRYGSRMVRKCFARFRQESEALMRCALREIPDGVYSGEDWLDDDGIEDGPIPVRVKITIDDDKAIFDFTGTGAQAKGPVNTTPFVTCSAVYYCLKALVGPNIPVNDGCYRPIRVTIPPVTILNPRPDAPVVGGNHETSYRVADAIFKALADVLPSRISAGGPTTSGIMIFGGQRNGSSYVLYECHAGGEGATVSRDGGHAVRVHVANTMNTPIEIIETEYPIEVVLAQLRVNSGGVGKHCGGLGQVRAYRLLDDANLTTMVERRKIPPWGIFGGENGAPFRITLNRNGHSAELKGKESRMLRAGDIVTIETSGGGGYGPLSDRAPSLVQRDIREGYRQHLQKL